MISRAVIGGAYRGPGFMSGRSRNLFLRRGRPVLAGAPVLCTAATTAAVRGPADMPGGIDANVPALDCCRRLAKDLENLNCSALAFLKLASIRLCCESYAILDGVPGRTLKAPAGAAPSAGVTRGFGRLGLALAPLDVGDRDAGVLTWTSPREQAGRLGLLEQLRPCSGVCTGAVQRIKAELSRACRR